VKIGIVCYPTYGGSGAVATELGQTLARRGHEVHLISYAPPFRLREFRTNLHFHAIEVSAYPLFRYPPYDLALASKIMEVALETGLDVVHAHYALPHAISAYLARQMLPQKRIRLVTTLHGTDITLVGLEKAYHEITRFGIWESDGVTVVSEWLLRETERIFHVGREMRVIPNFVDTERFAPDGEPTFRARLAAPDEKLIVHASNFRPVKRVPDVVRVFARIRERLPARLVLVGDGPDLPRAAELASELDVKDSLIFAGQQAAVETLLKVSDLFLLPSEFESFGLSALEALSCGVPVVGTSSGGTSEVVDHERAGFLFDVGDTDSMAEASLSLLEDEARHRRFGEAARASVLERFSEEDVVTRYESFYEELVGA
jgi:N-acetyl-alpha-D-glucosaminyl L-malate synthase BshA